MKNLWILACALIAASCSGVCDETVNVIPKPSSVEVNEGSFTFSGKSAVVCEDETLLRTAEIFAEDVQAVLGRQLEVKNEGAASGNVVLSLDDSLEAEEYELNVSRSGIKVEGGSAAGVFYGLQTLIQLVDDGKVQAVEIEDKPCFGHRGVLLDVARHFLTVEEVKAAIDIMAMHKINRFHWHLTDDQGWRIEIKKYPRLTEVGSIRKQTLVGKHDPNNHNYDGIPHGGFYTQDQIRDIVRYAADRHIDVLPEIDLPGHMQAALASYPELGCTGGPYELWCRWGISKDVLCAGNEKSYEFLKGVLDEVVELFPYEYIHIGGDECPKERWAECPKCQAKIKALGIEGRKAEHRLQSHVMNYMKDYLASKGRKTIGWDEVLEGGVDKSVTIMEWRDHMHAITAIQRGHDVILTPRHYCYFDYCQTSQPENEPLCVSHRYLSMRQAYRLDPFDRVMLHQQKQVLGMQCHMWAEHIPTYNHLQHMLLPRLAAFVETAWAYDRKDTYEVFAERAMELLPDYYDAFGLNYAPYFFEGIE